MLRLTSICLLFTGLAFADVQSGIVLSGGQPIPGAAVTWNGSYRTTTIIDATHVTVAIPASDLKAAGTGSLVATNPGAPASAALAVTVD